MIKANELRIGNILNYSDSFTPTDFDIIEVSVINNIDKIIRDKDDNIYSLDLLYPVPLTPEILEKAGFTHRQESFFHYYFKKYKSVLVEQTIELEYLDEKTYAWIEGNTIVHLGYLHQLQNLYFALTGEELQITL